MGFPVFIDIDSPSMTGILLLYYGLFYGSSGGWVSLPAGAIGVRARAGSGVTTSVSACGIGSWVSIRTTYPERRGHGRPPPLPPPRPPFAYCQSSFFLLTLESGNED